MHKASKIALSLALAACAISPQPTVISDLGQVPTFDRDTLPAQDGGKLRSAALDYYAKGDYVRALRFGYWAAQTIPTDVRLRLLLGIIYDGGFDLPDLALPEYQTALSLKPDRRFQDRLRHRVHFLSRRLLQDDVRTNIIEQSGNPLSENWLAVYPMAIEGPRNPDLGLEIALLDWVLPAIKRRSAGLHVDPFTSLIVAQVYREVATSPSAEDFARWCGAGTVLTGRLSDLGNNRLRLTLELLDAGARTVHKSDPFVIDSMDPASASKQVLDHAAKALGLLEDPLSTERADLITNPASMALYSAGLAQYLNGQVADAESNLSDARVLNPGSAFLDSRYSWADSDLLGGKEGEQLLQDYHRLLNLPYPQRAVRERLRRGHKLGSPAVSGAAGNETNDPYKPPRPDMKAQ
ncbi:MAG: hypothetical protein CME21_09210 [Gemmatimonadetes bacterium]|nr:hypothetical protein [Gemmatimonadota bacterium]